MMERAKLASCSGVNTIDDRMAVPPSPSGITRNDRVVVALGKDLVGQIHPPSPQGGRPIGTDQVLGASAGSPQSERPAQVPTVEHRRLACMRVHPSNGSRYLREVLSKRDAGNP